jgi:hypothetical protein
MTNSWAKPEQGGTASTVGFLKVISMAAFDPSESFKLII